MGEWKGVSGIKARKWGGEMRAEGRLTKTQEVLKALLNPLICKLIKKYHLKKGLWMKVFCMCG